MTTETTRATVTGIEITMDPQGLIGDGTTWEAEGLDEELSTSLYGDILTETLRGLYPRADVTLRWASTVATTIDVATDPDWTAAEGAAFDAAYAEMESIREHVQGVYEQVFEARHGDWAIEATA